MSRLLLVLSLLAAPGVALASAPVLPAVSRHVLPAGLVVLVRSDPGARVVAASLQVRAGSLFETTETAGITNFLHRVMVRGTRRHNALQLTEAIEEVGGALDASGDVEYGEVRGTALARNWEELLTLMAEVALHPTLPAEEVERERRLLQSSIQNRGEIPFQRALDAVLHELYGPHPYAWPSVGRRESIARIDGPALRAHYEAIYRPDRMVLAVSGQVPAERVFRVAERLFGAAPRRAGAPALTVPSVTMRTGRRVVERPAQQAQVLVANLAPPLTASDYPAVRVLGAVLGGGMSGRLFAELRDRRGLAYSIGTLGTFRTGPSFLVTHVGTSPAGAAAAEAGLRSEYERLRAEPVSERELARAKAYLLGTLNLDLRTNARRAWYLGFFEVIGAGWDFPERYASAVAAVTAADVTRAAERYLTRPTIVVLQPTGTRTP